MAKEIMIKTIRSFPCLWQTSSKHYKDLSARENVCKEVANHVSSIDGHYKGIHVYDHRDCKRKWKQIRDKYIKRIKKNGEAGPAYVPTWPLFTILMFLADSVSRRP